MILLALTQVAGSGSDIIAVAGVAIAALGLVSLIIKLHFDADKENRKLRDEELRAMAQLTASLNTAMDFIRSVVPIVPIRRRK